MQVAQSVFGKFHHFHLARQLQQREMLAGIFSSYPRRKLTGEGIPMEKVKTFPWVHLAWFANQKYGKAGGSVSRELSWWLALTLDDFAVRNLPPCEAFVGISGSGLKTGALVQKQGGIYVCDRGSSHIRYADQVLTEEFRRWGQEFPGVYPKHITREEAEYAQADAVTVPSEFARRTFIEMGVPAEKVRKVPYGADLSRFAKVADPPADSFDVLFVGQVSFRKGIPYLLQAFADFRHPKKTLTFVGNVQDEIKTYLQGKSLDGVEFAGMQPQTWLKERMSRSHVLVLPSIEEGLALVQGEAMACGCPIIASENTGADDLFTDGREGFIVPVRDASALTARLEQLAQDPALREAMSERALARVAGIGGWDVYGREYVATLNSLTRKGREVMV